MSLSLHNNNNNNKRKEDEYVEIAKVKQAGLKVSEFSEKKSPVCSLL